MKKVTNIFMLAGAGILLLAACGNGRHPNSDSTVNTMDTAATPLVPDTAPAAQMPPGAINPGEDSSRYGTGTEDSSKNRSRRP
ncbi:MAG: hypothetical protein J7623_21005 [Chitinophaga sp.]|uniref:hypothetical protein n=1 Tax=Chitinophaga sp. TaxID=1869181 RepID=UPI001B10B48B|nr:hypothetical protein [Chitinophaga sp.]MBO9731130.1 hypothetical protein [Chitinophaga sp.]